MLSSLAIAAPRCHAFCTAVRCNSFSGFFVFPDISIPRSHSFSLPLCLAQAQFFPPLSSPPVLLAESSQFIPMPQVQPPGSSRAEGQDLELRGGRGREERSSPPHSRGLQSPCQRPTPPRPFGASPRRCTRRAPSLPRGAAAAGQPRKRSSVGKRAVRAEPPHCFPMHMPVRQSFRSSRWRNMWSKPWS